MKPKGEVMKKKVEAGMNAGDIVRLKSGGPKATVAIVDATARTVRIVWFDHNAIQCVDALPVDTLVKVRA